MLSLLSLPKVLVPLVTVILTYTAPNSSRAREASECRRTGEHSENSREQRDGELIRWRAHWSGDNCSIDLRATGTVKFNADFTDVVSISRNGSFEVIEWQDRSNKRLLIRADGGGLERTWSVNGREQPWDDAGRRWLGEFLIELDRMTAFGIDSRFPAMMAQGGPTAVLDETDKMTGDYARSTYLLRLIDTTPLSDAQYQRVVNIVSKDVKSDYETSRVLRAVAAKSSLDNDAMRRGYLAAVDKMSSDYERSQVLQTIFAKSSITHEVAKSAVNSAASFKSDYERSQVLLSAIDSKALTADDLIPVIDAVAESKSDYEKARVLLAVAGRWALTPDVRKAYLRAADGIRSDYENRRVLAALVR